MDNKSQKLNVPACQSKVAGRKYQKLKRILRELESVLVAYSAGVDSSFLLKVASLVLDKDNLLAVTACSETYSRAEYQQALKFAQDFGVRHISVISKELNIKKFRENNKLRCYYCKRELFSQLKKVAQKEGLRFIVDGTTCDDLGDYRPGIRAAKELKVRSPLKEAGLTKDNVRKLSRKLNLTTWNKPQEACLASRFPYGSKITKRKLKQVERGEVILRELGFKQVRVRHYGKCCRIEVGKDEIDKFIRKRSRQRVIAEFKKLGFNYVTLDLEGYRAGSMNEALTETGE
jgi:uncharacterized protein